MGELVSVVVFIILVISSIAKKIQDQRLEAEERQRRAESRRRREAGQPQDEDETGEELPEATRRMLYGEPAEREARPREGSRPAQEPQRQARPLSPEDLMESLSGGSSPDEEEGEWQPVHRPQTRRELPGSERTRQPQRQSTHRPDIQRPQTRSREQARQRRQEAPQHSQERYPERSQELPRDSQEKQAAQSREQQQPRRRQQTSQKRKSPTEQSMPGEIKDLTSASELETLRQKQAMELHERQAAAAKHRAAAIRKGAKKTTGHLELFRDRDDVRRGILFVEILGPCRALKDYQPPSEAS